MPPPLASCKTDQSVPAWAPLGGLSTDGRFANIMTGFGFFRAIRAFLVLGIILVGTFAFFATTTVVGVANEISYRHRYGADWQIKFEKRYGPLSNYNQRLAATGFGTVAMPLLSIWIYKLLRTNPHTARGKKHQPQRRISRAERTILARRNALVGNYFGVGGIALGILLVVFRWRIFAEHGNEVILGIFVFCAGYCGVICGCWWWLKAKAWNEAVVFIGVAPLVVACIPFVRLIFLAAPLLLPAGMVMMPAILLVVVSVLPDKSGAR
jgi:uncharacterized membrane protein YidH (DUF202 family)